MKKTKLKDICNISAGGTPSRSNINYWNNGDIPWCKIGDFSGKYINQVKENITEEGLKNSSAKIFKRGTILYTIFATVGEVAILETESATNQAIAGLEIINNEVDLEYLYYYLKSLKFVMLKKSRGVAQNNINLGILKNIEIKIPSKIEQINIAKILDNIEKIIHKKKKQLKELNTIIKSQFVEMFGNVELNDKYFYEQEISDIAEITSSKRIYANEYQKNGVPFYRSKEIIELGHKKKPSIELYISIKKYKEIKEKYGIPKVGDILITAVGTIGETWIVNTEEPFYYKDGNVLQIRLKKENSQLYFKHVLDILINIFKRKNVSGSSYLALTIEKFKKMKMIIPPIDLQNQFAEIVKQIDKQKFESMIQLEKENKDSINNIIKGTIEETTILYEVLLKKCFEKGKMN